MLRLPEKHMKATRETNEDDLAFLRAVLPRGLTSHSLYYKAGDRYITSLLVYAYPSYLGDLLFADLFNRSGVIATLDVTQKPKDEAVADIESSVNELSNRGVINRNVSEDLNDAYELQDMKTLHASMQRTRESMVYTTLRFLVIGDTEAELAENVEKLQKELNTYGIKAMVPENEMLPEYRSLQNSADTVRQPMPVVETLERQFPYYFQSHTDAAGMVFGQTPTGGLVLLDTWQVDNDRKSYDIVITGNKGAGKSALLESMIQEQLSLGNKVMAIDVEGAMQVFAEKLGGKVIRPSSEEGRINVLQLRPMFSAKYEDSGESTAEKDIIRANYASEISRIVCFFYQIFPDMPSIEADTLKDMLEITFRKCGITEQTSLESLTPAAFPIMKDLLDTVRDALYLSMEPGKEPEYRPSLSVHKRDILEALEAGIKPLAEGVYASIFNGISTVDVSDEDLIIFDVSMLSEMEESVYNAQLLNILALEWGEIYQNRVINDGIPEDQQRKCVSVFDEAHRFINTRNAQGLMFIDKLVRRGRKYLAALWFASQSPRDFAPSGESEQLDKIKSIFAMVQYKILMQQDDSSFEIIEKLFPQFTQSEVENTTFFGKGDMLLSLGAGQKIRCNRYIPKEDFEYFGGGR